MQRKIFFYIYIYKTAVRRKSCTSNLTEIASHKTWKNIYSAINPLTAADASLCVNFELKIWLFSSFLE